MAIRSPSGGLDRSGDNCPLLSLTARFLIWATRNTRKADHSEAERR